MLIDVELRAVLAKAIKEQSTFGRIVELLICSGQRVKQITTCGPNGSTTIEGLSVGPGTV
jgi:hypothetical protein